MGSGSMSSAQSYSQLLRRTKLSSYNPKVDQVYTADSANLHRMNFGLKRNLPSIYGQTLPRAPYIRVYNLDGQGQLKQTEWRKASKEALFMKKFQEMTLNFSDQNDGKRSRAMSPSMFSTPTTSSSTLTSSYMSPGGSTNASQEDVGRARSPFGSAGSTQLGQPTIQSRYVPRTMKGSIESLDSHSRREIVPEGDDPSRSPSPFDGRVPNLLKMDDIQFELFLQELSGQKEAWKAFLHKVLTPENAQPHWASTSPKDSVDLYYHAHTAFGGPSSSTTAPSASSPPSSTSPTPSYSSYIGYSGASRPEYPSFGRDPLSSMSSTAQKRQVRDAQVQASRQLIRRVEQFLAKQTFYNPDAIPPSYIHPRIGLQYSNPTSLEASPSLTPPIPGRILGLAGTNFRYQQYQSDILGVISTIDASRMKGASETNWFPDHTGERNPNAGKAVFTLTPKVDVGPLMTDLELETSRGYGSFRPRIVQEVESLALSSGSVTLSPTVADGRRRPLPGTLNYSGQEVEESKSSRVLGRLSAQSMSEIYGTSGGGIGGGSNDRFNLRRAGPGVSGGDGGGGPGNTYTRTAGGQTAGSDNRRAGSTIKDRLQRYRIAGNMRADNFLLTRQSRNQGREAERGQSSEEGRGRRPGQREETNSKHDKELIGALKKILEP